MNTEKERFKNFGKELKDLRIKYNIGARTLSTMLDIKLSKLLNLQHGRINANGTIDELNDNELLKMLPAITVGVDPEEREEVIEDLFNKIKQAWK